MYYYYTLLVLIIISGIIGGTIKYFLYDDTMKEIDTHKFIKDIITGIGSSLLVPLFLNMISSDLLNHTDNIINLFVFAGICLLFSISAKPMIESMSDRILHKIIDKQEDTEKRVDQLIEIQIQPEHRSLQSPRSNHLTIPEEHVEWLKVIQTISNGNQPLKSKSYLEEEINLSNLDGILEILTKKNLIAYVTLKNTKYFYLTANGKEVNVSE